MNRLKNILLAILAVGAVISCRELPSPDAGAGYLSVSLSSSDELLTRGIPAEDQIFSLDIYDKADNLIEHVEDFRSLEAEPLKLLAGPYTVKAYSNTEADAAWDTAFYTGEKNVRIYPEKVNNTSITCLVNNVVVSASFDEAFVSNVRDYSLVVSNGKADMTFSEEEGTLDKKAYFSVTGTLEWTLTFTNPDGKVFTAENSYTDVRAQQHYKLEFSVADPEEITAGAAGIRLIVDDSINEEKTFDATVYDGLTEYPNIFTNAEFDISGVVSIPKGNETPKKLTAYAKHGISSWRFMDYELVGAGASTIAKMEKEGIAAAAVDYGATSATMDITGYVSKLEMGQYVLETAVYDAHGHMTEKKIMLDVQSNVDADANSVKLGATTAILKAKWYGSPRPEGLGLEYRIAGQENWTIVEPSVLVFDESERIFSALVEGLVMDTEYEFRPYSDGGKELPSMKFRTKSVQIDGIEVSEWAKFLVINANWYEQSDPYFEYRKAGSSVWNKVDQSLVEYDGDTSGLVAEIRGLDPSSTYEVRALLGNAEVGQFGIRNFTTETAGTVYNLSFDDWYQSGKVWYPYAQGANPSIWDSANPGTATFGGSKTTREDNDVVRGKAAKMESDYVVVKFAAGNIYTGKFGEVSGMGAELDWGVPFESRPLALKGYYKYNPVAIDNAEGDKGAYKGQMDKMQIQIFITDWTGTFHINTTAGQFVDIKNDPSIIAHGKIESDVKYDTYQEFTIPLEYRSLTKTPKYIVISACSSYLGDYFTGGDGSTLWIDEFSLEYDPSNLTPEEIEKVNYR